MRWPILTGLAAAILSAAACGENYSQMTFPTAEAPAYVPPPPDLMDPGPPSGGTVAQGRALRAYAYEVGVRVANDRVKPLVEAHSKACADAGADVCEILSASINSTHERSTSGEVRLRAQPKWLDTFRSGLPAEIKKLGGVVTREAVESEDLTDNITDTEARLAAKKALRDRILALLGRRDASLADAVAAEEALAEVQSDIDRLERVLATAKKRVAMSALTLTYTTEPSKSDVVVSPVARSVRDFGGNLSQSLARLIDLIANGFLPAIFALTLVLVLRPLLWRRKGR